MRHHAHPHRSLRCLDGQRIAPKLATTGALERAAQSPAPSGLATLIGAAVMFLGIVIALVAIVAVARSGGCQVEHAPVEVR